MAGATSSRRSRWVIIGILTVAILTIASVAMGIAMTGPADTIVLVIDDDTREFQFGNTTQQLTPGDDTCRLSNDSLSGPLIEMAATTYTRRGALIDPAYVGLVDDGIGVNKRGRGDARSCGRIDYLGSNRSEALTMSLGSLLEGRMISSIDFDLSAKHDARISVEFLRGDTVIDQIEVDLSDEVDDGPDSKYHDKYSLSVSTPEGLFDGVRLTMTRGSVSVEGGAEWDHDHEHDYDYKHSYGYDHDDEYGHDYDHDHEDDADDHRTVFYLAEAVPEIAIEVATNGEDADSPTGPYVEVGQPVTWTYTVTNPGDLPLNSVAVVDDRGATVAFQGGDTNGDNVLDTTETWTYTANGMATAGQYANLGSVTGSPDFGDAVGASDPSHYFGSDPAITIVKMTNGPGDAPSDGPFITTGDDVTWTYTVTNGGNVALNGVSVTDDDESVDPSLQSGDSNGNGRLDTSETWVFTASGTAEESVVGSPYSNLGTTTGTPPVGDDVSGTDSSSYFGSNPAITIEVANNGPVVVTGDDVVWDFTVRNTGNVPLTLVQVTEGETEVCALDDIGPGGSTTCQYSAPAMEGEQATTFTARGTGTLEVEATETSEIVGYFGGLDCGQSISAGGPGIDDDPLAGLYVGPNSKGATECAVATQITTITNPGVDQVVNVAPPSGFDWTGVTGIVTIAWDAESADLDAIGRTYQRLIAGDPLSDIVIPWCGNVIPVTLSPGSFTYELVDPNALFPTATGGGDVCLILQNTAMVDDAGTVSTQTTEAFYVWNDPRFSRK